jgi:methyl-accepting chemotaxis protein
MARSRRHWQNALRIEQKFQLRQLLRIVGLTWAFVLLSTMALGVLYCYALQPPAWGAVPVFVYYGEFGGRSIMLLGLRDTLILWASLMTGLSVIFAAVTGLYFSHAMAGPIYRIKEELKRVVEGKAIRAISLRKGDEFQDIAEAMNQALERVRRASAEPGNVLESEEALKRLEDAHLAVRNGLDSLDTDRLCKADAEEIEAWRERMRQLLSKPESAASETTEVDPTTRS